MSAAVVGSVAVDIVPSARSFGQKLRDTLIPDANRVGEEAGRVLSERIQSALGDARVQVDTAGALGEIDRIREHLRSLGADSAHINVNVDTAGATAHLDEFRARLDELDHRRVNVDVNVDDHGSSGSAQGGISGLLLAGLALGPALIPVAAAAVPAIAGIGLAAVGAAAGVGVLALAFHGIGGAVSALGAQSKQTGQQLAQQAATQLASADSILNAQDAVRAAVVGVADAQRSAAQSAQAAEVGLADARRSAALSVTNAVNSVRTAEQGLTSAQYTEQQAQVNLTLARRQAAQTLQDLSNQVKDGALTQRQATIDLQNAQQNLTVVDFNPHSTSQQRAEAQLQVDQAKQHLSELELANIRLAQTKATADKQGVANAPTVLSAEHALTDATQARINAQQKLVKAQAAVVEAERAGAEQVGKAQATLAEAQRSGAEQVVKAQEQVVSSQRALAQAYASAGAQGSSAANAVAAAMAGLTPAGQRFALFIHNELQPAFKTLTNSAQSGFLPGFQQALTILLPYMPKFADFVKNIATELGNLAVKAAKTFTDPFWKQFFGFLGDIAGPAMETLFNIVLNLATAFAGLFEAFAPAGKGVGDGLVSLTKKFADFATHLGTNAGFQKFLQYIKDNAPGVGQFLKNLGEIFGKLIVGLAPWGAILAGIIEKVAAFLAKLSPSQLAGIFAAISGFIVLKSAAGWVGQLTTTIRELGPVIRELGPVIHGLSSVFSLLTSPIGLVIVAVAAIVAGLIYAYFHFKTFRTIVDDVFHAVEAAAVWLWKDVLQPTFNFIVDHWHYVASAFKLYWDYFLHPVLDGLWTTIKWIWENVISPTFTWIGDHWHLLGSGFKIVYDTFLSPLWTSLKTAFTTVGKAFGAFRDGLSAVWNDIKSIFTSGVNFVTQNILNKFINAINAITGLLGVAKIKTIDKIGVAAPHYNSVGGPNKKAFKLGGVLPGWSPGYDNITMPAYHFSGGEGILVPEATRALGGEAGIKSINSMFSNRVSSPGHFFGGGVVSAVENVLGSGAGAALSAAESPIKSLIAGLTPEIIKRLAQGGFNQIDKGVRGFLGTHPGSPAASGGAEGPVPTGDHKALIDQALRLAKVAVSGGNEAAVDMIVKFESGWNPRAINLSDSNYLAGHPSMGLMQTIISTFEGNRLGTLPDDVYNPLANLVAGIRYATSRYGSLQDVPGVRAVNAGGSYVGYDNGGFLKPGVTQVYNGTGRPEPVFTDAQWAKLSAGHGSPQRHSGKLAENLTINEANNTEYLLAELGRRQYMAGLT